MRLPRADIGVLLLSGRGQSSALTFVSCRHSSMYRSGGELTDDVQTEITRHAVASELVNHCQTARTA